MARSGALGSDRDRLEGVVIGKHVGKRRGLPGELESVEYVRHPVGEDNRRAICHLEVQMWAAGGARAARFGDVLPAGDPVARVSRSRCPPAGARMMAKRPSPMSRMTWLPPALSGVGSSRASPTPRSGCRSTAARRCRRPPRRPAGRTWGNWSEAWDRRCRAGSRSPAG